MRETMQTVRVLFVLLLMIFVFPAAGFAAGEFEPNDSFENPPQLPVRAASDTGRDIATMESGSDLDVYEFNFVDLDTQVKLTVRSFDCESCLLDIEFRDFDGNVHVQEYMTPGVTERSFTVGRPQKGVLTVRAGSQTLGQYEIALVAVSSRPADSDSDSDGVPDVKDKCPQQAGVSFNEGCPPSESKDNDADGSNDAQDPCPTEKGSADYAYCPPGKGPKPDGTPYASPNPQTGPGCVGMCRDPITGQSNDKGDPCSEVGYDVRFCKNADADADGIKNKFDKCPFSYGIKVGPGGCEKGVPSCSLLGQKIKTAQRRLALHKRKAKTKPTKARKAYVKRAQKTLKSLKAAEKRNCTPRKR